MKKRLGQNGSLRVILSCIGVYVTLLLLSTVWMTDIFLTFMYRYVDDSSLLLNVYLWGLVVVYVKIFRRMREYFSGRPIYRTILFLEILFPLNLLVVVVGIFCILFR
ncbi:MAG: hypothetical protein K2O49_01345 [Muribaculaceae bacterium]|nr:hypothetical protein [Muribaculaceae bacterium]